MNSGSGHKLSMEELKRLHQPTPTPQAQTTTMLPAQEQPPSPEVHPTKEEWKEMMEYICTLTRHTERQTASVTSGVGLADGGHSYDGAGGGSVASALVESGRRLEQTQSTAPVMDATTRHHHADSKTLRKERQKKIAQGHATDDHAEEQTWQQTM